jgi:putative peptidoglycan binding protein
MTRYLARRLLAAVLSLRTEPGGSGRPTRRSTAPRNATSAAAPAAGAAAPPAATPAALPAAATAQLAALPASATAQPASLTTRPARRPAEPGLSHDAGRVGAAGLVIVMAALALVPLAAGTAHAAPAAAAPAPVPIPRVPAGLPAGIEPLAAYVPQKACDPTDKPGAVTLGRLLTTTYPGTSAGIARPCGGGPNSTSEHFEGRAVDWMDSVRDPRQAAQAAVLIRWLLAPDSRGNGYAYARRLGVMYLIWNDRIWSAGDPHAGWQPYQDCARHPEPDHDTTCHRNHVHISLSWAGAMGRTSFWTRRVDAATDYGPCRPADLNWAVPYRARNAAPCARFPRVSPRPGDSAVKVALTTYSGAVLRGGYTGPAVAAVQQALRTPAGPYGRVTATAVAAFQRAHGLRPTRLVDTWTWRALLRAYH